MPSMTALALDKGVSASQEGVCADEDEDEVNNPVLDRFGTDIVGVGAAHELRAFHSRAAATGWEDDGDAEAKTKFGADDPGLTSIITSSFPEDDRFSGSSAVNASLGKGNGVNKPWLTPIGGIWNGI